VLDSYGERVAPGAFAESLAAWATDGRLPAMLPSGHASQVKADALITLIGELKEDYHAGAVWLMKRSTVTAVMLLKDGTGQYIWRPGLQDGTPQTLLGYTIRHAAHMDGTPTVVLTNGSITQATLDPAGGALVLACADGSEDAALLLAATIAGGDISFGDPAEITGKWTSDLSVACDGTGGIAAAAIYQLADAVTWRMILVRRSIAGDEIALDAPLTLQEGEENHDGEPPFDSVALLNVAAGRLVLVAKSVRRWGAGFLDALNAGRTPRFAFGGLVEPAPLLPRAFALAADPAPAAPAGRPLVLNLPFGRYDGAIGNDEAQRLRHALARSAAAQPGSKPGWYR
jgi:hypothetical protein